MQAVLRLAALGLAVLACSCASTKPARLTALCDLDPVEWRYLPSAPAEAGRLQPQVDLLERRRFVSVAWFESAEPPRELIACIPGPDDVYPRLPVESILGCGASRVRFGADMLIGKVATSEDSHLTMTVCGH